MFHRFDKNALLKVQCCPNCECFMGGGGLPLADILVVAKKWQKKGKCIVRKSSTALHSVHLPVFSSCLQEEVLRYGLIKSRNDLGLALHEFLWQNL